MPFNHIEKNIIKAAKDGGRIVKHYYNHHLKAHEKSQAADFFTRADIEAENRIIKSLQEKLPHANIEAEESGKINNHSEYTFVIDPIDGTNNFYSGVPYFSVSIALVKRGEPVFAVVHNPLTGDLYWAKKDQGAYKNDKRIKCSSVDSLKDSIAAYVSGYTCDKKRRLKIMARLYDHGIARIHDNWCPTLDYCLFACGHIDCVITHEDDMHETKIGWLFIKESGGIVYDYSGRVITKDRNKKFISVGSKKLIKELLPIVIAK